MDGDRTYRTSSPLDKKPDGVIRVVVLGGGFGGAYCVQHLENALRWRPELREKVEIVLIDRNNYFAFSPLLVEAGTGSLQPSHAVVGLRQFCRKARFVAAEVVNFDLKAKTVDFRISGEAGRCTTHFDHLVLSMGTVTLKPPVPGLKEYGYEMKSLADAIALRERVVRLLERANAIDSLEKRRELLTLTVIGGGFTGIEVAGEFDQYLKKAVRSYPRLSERDVQVVVLNRGDRLLGTLHEELGKWTHDHLVRRGIDVRMKTEATAIHPNEVELSDGTRLPANTVVWCAGIMPNPSVKFFDVPTDKRGYILCERDCRVKGHDAVWALGDAAVNPQASGDAYPATAQAAVRQAKFCARNIVHVLEGEPTKPADFKDLGQLAAFGHGDAVAETFGMRFTGWFAWFLWRGVYLMKMPGLGRKIRVAVDWTLDLVTRRDFVELGVTPDKPSTEVQDATSKADDSRSIAA
ncbi:MAG: NAD(P)/FAD-dependent oxidoreductase [Planctomycetota bacterium]